MVAVCPPQVPVYGGYKLAMMLWGLLGMFGGGGGGDEPVDASGETRAQRRQREKDEAKKGRSSR